VGEGEESRADSHEGPLPHLFILQISPSPASKKKLHLPSRRKGPRAPKEGAELAFFALTPRPPIRRRSLARQERSREEGKKPSRDEKVVLGRACQALGGEVVSRKKGVVLASPGESSELGSRDFLRSPASRVMQGQPYPGGGGLISWKDKKEQRLVSAIWTLLKKKEKKKDPSRGFQHKGGKSIDP